MARSLNTVKANQPPDKLTDYCICLYGLKGAGKSSLCAQFPNAVTLQLEPRRRNLKIRQVVPDDWLDLKEWLKAFLADKSRPTCVVDTVDYAYQMCFDHICKEAGCEHPTDMNDYGKTWVAIREEFAGTFNQLLYRDVPVIFTSHHKAREDDLVNDNKDAKFAAPTCTPQAWNYLKQVCDFAFYLGYYGGRRSLTLRGDETIWAACGVDNHFLDPKGNPVKTILLSDDSPQAAYKALMDSWDNKLYDANPDNAVAAVSPKKADPEKKFERKLPKGR